MQLLCVVCWKNSKKEIILCKSRNNNIKTFCLFNVHVNAGILHSFFYCLHARYILIFHYGTTETWRIQNGKQTGNTMLSLSPKQNVTQIFLFYFKKIFFVNKNCLKHITKSLLCLQTYCCQVSDRKQAGKQTE